MNWMKEYQKGIYSLFIGVFNLPQFSFNYWQLLFVLAV